MELETAKKYLALSFQAYESGMFDEAGMLFAQAMESTSAQKLTNALMVPVGAEPPTQQNLTKDNMQQLSEDEEEQAAPTEAEDEESESDDEDFGEESTSSDSPKRRTTTSLHSISQQLSAAMEAISADGEDEEDEEFIPTSDPDLEGEEEVDVVLSGDVELVVVSHTPLNIKL